MSSFLFETEEHTELRRQTRRFAAKEIAPHAHTWDEAGEFPRELYTQAGEAGLLGLGFPEALGGTGGDATHALVMGDELILAGKNAGVAAGLGTLGIALPPILHLGNNEQQQRFIPPVLRGEQVAALAVTEPGVGSDVANIVTRARLDGEDYVIDGSKTFITSGTRADIVLTAVRTGDPGHAGISMIVVETDRPGFGVSKKLAKMGWCASDTAELYFEGCRVPATNRIGDENFGFGAIMLNFFAERLFVAGQAVAIAELAYQESIAYARERQAFNKSLMGFQVTRHKLADMATRIAAARALVGEAATRYVAGEQNAGLAAKTKNAATDALSWVVDQAVQIHGGYGFMREYTVERLYRDARLYPIGAGTREIMNEVIAKAEDY